jgi:hypothetical protein
MRSNIKTLAALLMAGAAMTACSNNDENILEEVSQPDQPKVYTMTVEATKGDNGTRGLVLDNDYLKVKWDEGETVIVMKWDDTEWKKIGELTAVASETASTTLNGTLTEAPEANNTKLFLHGTSVSYDNQQGTLEYIAEKCDFATAMIENVKLDETTNNITVSGIKFISQQAIVQFHLLDKEGHDLQVTKLKIEDGGGNMCKELNASTGNLQDLGHVNGSVEINYSDGTGTMFVALANVRESSKLKFTAKVVGVDAYTYVYEITDVALEEGKYYDIKVKMKDVPAIDLSMLDCAGTPRASRWTANCYMVHTAGNYKLPLVYGNAIKDGATNANAYTGVEGNNVTLTFPRHDGQAITDPWIKNNGITVKSAQLLWQDAQGLITTVGIDGDYLTLTVGKDATTQEGNALIAAKDADGTIVWSWHIWVTKQTFTDLVTVATGSHDYQVTPVNLGWVGNATSATGYQTYYQWGRKDPFIGTGEVTYVSDNNSTVTIADNIKNPTTFYRVGAKVGTQETDKPSIAEYRNMWDAQQTSNSNNIATATKKTVYDPSPAGFCVPTGNLYYYIKNGSGFSFTWDATNKGRNMTLTSVNANVFFPASGYRARGSGLIGNVGSYGYYWSASACYGYSGRYLYFTSNQRDWHNSYRANGFSVRAVAEEQ